MYEQGWGVPQNYKKAVDWYRQGAEHGDSGAQRKLARMYFSGRGVVQNFEETVRWYRAAAEQGFVSAQVDLGWIYQKGFGAVQNFVKAQMWYNIAAANGGEYASEWRNRVAAQMTPQQIAEAQALAVQCMNSNYTDC